MTRLELAEACEKATGPDREIDADILCEANGWTRCAWVSDGRLQYRCPGILTLAPLEIHVPAYTGSLDAITAIAAEKLTTWTAVELRSRRQLTVWIAEFSRLNDLNGGEDYATGRANHLARAYAAAFLRALAQEQTDD